MMWFALAALAASCLIARLLVRTRRDARAARLARAAAERGEGVASMRETLLRRLDKYSDPRL